MKTVEDTKPGVDARPTARSASWLEAVSLQLMLVIVALAVQALWPRVTGIMPGVKILLTGIPTFPWNWLCPVCCILAGVVGGAVFYRQAWMRWLSGVPFAVTATLLVAFISGVGTVIVQDSSKATNPLALVFTGIYTSLPFVTAVLFLLLSLSTVLGTRLATPRRGHAAFLLNHGGLILIILGMLAGSAQLEKLVLQLREGEFASQAVDEQGHQHDLGGTVTLNKFEIEKFPPKLAAAEFNGMNDSHTVSDQDWVAKGRVFRAFGMTVHVLDFLPMAMPDAKEQWVSAAMHGIPAAKIEVTNVDGKQQTEWVTPGIESLGIVPRVLKADDRHVIGLLEPTPKIFRSALTLDEPGKGKRDVMLEVNQPVKLGDWMLYQTSYDISMMGRSSVMQIVRDPALPVVYLGFACIVLGTFLALWSIPKRKDSDSAAPVVEEAAI